jgi:hypothetical protein
MGSPAPAGVSSIQQTFSPIRRGDGPGQGRAFVGGKTAHGLTSLTTGATQFAPTNMDVLVS